MRVNLLNMSQLCLVVFNMIQCATPGRAPIFDCRNSWLCCRLANIFNLQNESFLYLLLPGKYNFSKHNKFSFIHNHFSRIFSDKLIFYNSFR